jgi:PST family polysaccharide transporter/lipopolysaccharide exporter
MIRISAQITNAELATCTLKGTTWFFLARLLQQGLNFLQLVILARLLEPRDFGLMAIALVATQFFSALTYTGYEFALVQKPHLSNTDLHTAWWVMLGRRVLMGAALILLAIPIANFYKLPEVIPILMAVGGLQALQGLTSPAPSLWQKSFQFRKFFSYQVLPAFFGLLLSTIAAFVLQNVWALVISMFSAAAAQVFLSYFLDPYRPSFCIERKSLAFLSSYGKWMFASGLLFFSSSQGTYAFAGWMFGVAALGVYQMASRFALIVSSQFSEVILGTVFPAYSLIQDDIDRLSDAFLHILNLTTLLVCSVTVTIALGLPNLFILIIGAKWTEAACILPWIAIAGGISAILRTASPLYLGTGHPRYQFFLDLVPSVVTLIFLYPLGNALGLDGLPFATIIGGICTFPIWWIGIRKTTKCTKMHIFQAVLPALIGGFTMSMTLAIGLMPGIIPANVALAILWNLFVIIAALGGFVLVAWRVQFFIPGRHPLQDLTRIITNLWETRHFSF